MLKFYEDISFFYFFNYYYMYEPLELALTGSCEHLSEDLSSKNLDLEKQQVLLTARQLSSPEALVFRNKMSIYDYYQKISGQNINST